MYWVYGPNQQDVHPESVCSFDFRTEAGAVRLSGGNQIHQRGNRNRHAVSGRNLSMVILLAVPGLKAQRKAEQV